MADKQVPLSIVLRTVDKATAGIQAVNKRLDAITKPTRDFGKALGELGEKSGLVAVVDGFKGVGGAIQGLLEKVAVIGGVAALAVHGVLSLVDEFDNLGDKAEKLGVTVDFFSAMRFAAERSGASVEEFDQGITSLGESMGQLRAGTGRMLKFLSGVSPALVTQLKATKGNEAAFRLLADAMEQLTDPQKRLTMAQKTVGNSALAPMLARGSKGLRELQGEFAGLAGSQEDAAEAAGKTDDALKNLKAATTGVKAALVTGLAPALTIVVEKLTQWFVDHREDVKQWAADIGEKLPGAVDAVVKAITKAVGSVTSFVEGIGGLKVALVLLAAAMVGPTIAAFVKLGIAMVANPFGLVLVAVSALVAGLVLLVTHFDKVIDGYNKVRHALGGGTGVEDIDKIIAAPNGAEAMRSLLTQPAGSISDEAVIAGLGDAGGTGFSLPTTAPANAKARVKVEFTNAPHGTRVTTDPRSTVDVDTWVGYQMGFGL